MYVCQHKDVRLRRSSYMKTSCFSEVKILEVIGYDEERTRRCLNRRPRCSEGKSTRQALMCPLLCSKDELRYSSQMHPLAFSKDPHSVSSYRVVICTAFVVQQQRRNHTDETQPGHLSNISTSSASLTRIHSSGARYHVPIRRSRSTYRYVA
jgi:hypothetical protein